MLILLAFGLGVTLLAVWGRDRRRRGEPLLPRAPHGRLGRLCTALLPATLVMVFFLLRPLPPPAAVSSSIVSASPPAKEKSVAVLPFENLSADKDNAFFADGVQDEVLTDLAKVADLKVISRTSVMQYRDASRNLPDIARALGVAYVVEGSVQRANNKIRVTAQLIDARTDSHRWAETYDRDLSDVFAIQSDIAEAIAGQLQAAISPQEHTAMEEVPTHELKAYEFYLRAVELWNSIDEPTLDVSVRTAALLKDAVTRDPGFARAFAFLADVQGQHYRYFATTPAQAALVRGIVDTVARLRPGSGDAHRAEGTYAYSVQHDYERAREEFTATMRLSPNDATALYYLALTDRRQGHWRDALDHIRQAVALDPEDVGSVSALADINAQTDDAIVVPRAFYRGCLARYGGDKTGARSAFHEARLILAERVRGRPGDAGLLLFLAATDAALGKVPEALAEGQRGAAMQPPDADATDGPGLALLPARVLAWSGERDEAIRTLQTLAAKPNGPGYGSLHLHPDWDALRGEARFEALVASLQPKP